MTTYAPITTNNQGENRRLKTEEARTSFYQGKEFRTFKEWPTATTATYVIKAVVPINIILLELDIQIEEGAIRIETVVGGTEGGTFSETLPMFATNNMTEKPQPAYANVTTLTAGGTHAGGTVLDVLRTKTSGNSQHSGSVGSGSGSERGVAPNTYYFRITLTAAVGTFKARYEERPN